MIKAETLVLGAYVPEGWKLNGLAEQLLQKKVVMTENFQCWEWENNENQEVNQELVGW